MLSKTLKFHFIAIGGVGMSALAKYLLEAGYIVSGSDIKESKYTDALKEKGATIYIGHSAKNVPLDAIVVLSSAIKQDNPEYRIALANNLKIYHRSDVLKFISDGLNEKAQTYFIGFSGTHGKTTTSGLCSYVLYKSGYKPSFAVGGTIPELNTNSLYSGGKYFVAELDESDGTITKYAPNITVINNLEVDHVDFYKDGFQTLLDTFNLFLSKLYSSSKVVINIDCQGCQKLMNLNSSINFVTYSLAQKADFMAKNILYRDLGSCFDVYYKQNKLGNISLNLFGEHNVYNALAVVAALVEAGIDFDKIKENFHYFSGMGRRFQFIAEENNIKIYDDYAHHPSEIKSTLTGIKKTSTKRIVLVFQPHRYTRLKGLWQDFLTAFDNADKIFITDVFAAGDEIDSYYNSSNLAKQIQHNDCVYVSGDINQISSTIAKNLTPDDLVITMGAGDITKLGNYLVEILKNGAIV